MDNKSEEIEIKNNDNMKKNGNGKKKNVGIMCIAFVCVFTASNAVNNLQSIVLTFMVMLVFIH